MTSAAAIDTTKPFRSVPRLVQLVRYVLATSPDNEPDWVEWKCGLDLSKAAGRFAVAKQIIGFGNRDPRRAATHAGGCAFIVLGAEPGNLQGQPAMDPAKVESALRSYVGTDGPDWLPQTVDVDGKDVVIVTVEAPQWGDPIHTLRKTYTPQDGSGAKDGEVFVRRPGGTHPATSAELQILQRRLLSRPAEGLEIVVQSVGEPIPRVDLSEEAASAWLAAERKRLLDPLEADQRERAGSENTVTRPLTNQEQRQLGPSLQAMDAIGRSMADFGRASTFLSTTIAEDRDPEEYREAVDEYLQEAGNCIQTVAFSRFESVVEVPLALRVVNTGDRNLESVELVVLFGGPVLTADDEGEADMPASPRVWGPRKKAFSIGLGDRAQPTYPWDLNIPTFEGPGFTAKSSGSTTIEFDAFDLRPHKDHDLPDVPLVVASGLTGSISGTSTATAKNRDGRAEGSVAVPLADAVVSVSDLIGT